MIPGIVASHHYTADGDPYFAYKVLGLHMDGTNGSTTFTDIKGNTVTAYGNAQISTAQYAALTGNSASGSFDGTGDYLVLGARLLSTGDFTVAGWVRPTAIPGAAYLYAQYNTQTDSSKRTIFGYVSDGIYFQCGSTTLLPANGAPTIDSWNYLEFCRVGTTLYGFLNGTLKGTLTSFSATLSTAVGSVSAGYVNGSGWTQGFVTGNLDDLEIYSGWGRHTAGYTPPTAPFLDY